MSAADKELVPEYISEGKNKWMATWKAVYNETGSEKEAYMIANKLFSPNAVSAIRTNVHRPHWKQYNDQHGNNIRAKLALAFEQENRRLPAIVSRPGGMVRVGDNIASTLLAKDGGSVVKSVRGVKSHGLQATEDGWIEGYLVSWGSREDTDLQGEYFTPESDFCLDWFVERPVLYHHGMDDKAGLRKIGFIKSIHPDELGLWVQAQLDLRDRYASAVYDMVRAKEFGWSSGSVDHLVKIAETGEIKTWPIIEGSITPTPAQPSKTTVRALKSILMDDPDISSDYLTKIASFADYSDPYYDEETSARKSQTYFDLSYGDTFRHNAKKQKGVSYMTRISRRGERQDAGSRRSFKNSTMEELNPQLPSQRSRLARRTAMRGGQTSLNNEGHLGEYAESSASRRVPARRGAMRQTEPMIPVSQVGQAVQEAAVAAYRRAMRQMESQNAQAARSSARRGAMRQTEPLEDAVASRRARMARRGAYRQQEMAAPVAPAPVPAPAPVAPVAPAPQPSVAFRRGYTRTQETAPSTAASRAAMRRARRQQEGVEPVASRSNVRGRMAGKSADEGSASYWQNRAMKAESRAVKAERAEVPGQRRFGNVKMNTDVAEKEDRYLGAFKSYLYNGLGLMTDAERYVLRGKGRVSWGKSASGSFAFDSNTRSVKTIYSGSDAGSGFAVPPDWVSDLNKNVMNKTVMAGECNIRNTTSDRIVQPNLVTTDARRVHAAAVRWPGEQISDPTTETRTIEDQYSQVDIPIHIMLMTMAATNQALEDATFNLEAELNEAFSEAVAVSYDQLIYAGDGQGKLEGIVTNPQVTSAASFGIQTVGGYVATGSTDGIVTGDTLKAMIYHLPQSYRQNAKWYMNSNTALQIATLKDGDGNYLIDERHESMRNTSIPQQLLGRPIVFNEWASDIASGAYPIVLGDLKKGYMVGRRVDFSIRRFDDSRYAEYDQVLFLGRARLGGQVLQPAAMKVLKVAVS